MLSTDFRDNEISDLSPLVSMAEEDRRDGVRFTPFWRLFLDGNPLDATTKLAVQTLEKLGVRLDVTDKKARTQGVRVAEQEGDDQRSSDDRQDPPSESKQ